MVSPYDVISIEEIEESVDILDEKSLELLNEAKRLYNEEFEKGVNEEGIDTDGWNLRLKLWAQIGVKTEAARLCFEKVRTMLSILKERSEVK